MLSLPRKEIHSILKRQIMMLESNFRALFIDPISLEIMTDPVINTCGHTFERGQIEGWRATRIAVGAVRGCPLCSQPLGNLIPNRLCKDAIEILTLPDNRHLTSMEDLTEEEFMQVQDAIDAIIERRQIDQTKKIPSTLPKPLNFLTRFTNAVSDICC